MKIQHMTGRTGRPVANQFILPDVSITYKSRTGETIKPPKGTMFQSYDSCIAFIGHDGSVFLDENYWDYSVTTSKYRNRFLNSTTEKTQAKIDSGEYKLTDLN